MRMNAALIFASALLASGCVMQQTYERERQLNAQLQAEVQSDQVQIQQLQDRLRITVENDILYASGQAGLSRSGRALLDQLVPTLNEATDHRIEIEGYTDNVPVGHHLKGKYKTNWELSSARAAGVVEYLQSKGIDPSRMTAAGHGQYQPSADNSTAEGRAQNRRTDIDLVPIYTQ